MVLASYALASGHFPDYQPEELHNLPPEVEAIAAASQALTGCLAPWHICCHNGQFTLRKHHESQ